MIRASLPFVSNTQTSSPAAAIAAAETDGTVASIETIRGSSRETVASGLTTQIPVGETATWFWLRLLVAPPAWGSAAVA